MATIILSFTDNVRVGVAQEHTTAFGGQCSVHSVWITATVLDLDLEERGCAVCCHTACVTVQVRNAGLGVLHLQENKGSGSVLVKVSRRDQTAIIPCGHLES
ncbi:hypothetical protein ElyMa_004137900 [Elysia marginata]|uniref:Uncharacterized protein n=1 Tax=Elysia marginata TaxID=1093978 RepID=A0AAV4GEV8_9GAST|nr:hypothetical protein ElyMa_004137900 [Elysia marginata]